MGKSVCVIGAGMSGLAAIRELTLGGHEVCCYEAGSDLGGSWRYENDNERSAAYESLTTNVSRRNMRYASLAIPGRRSKRLSHRELLAYLERYAHVNRLRERIRFGARVSAARPSEANGWSVWVGDEPAREFDGLIVASGCLWDPHVPELAGGFAGEALHVRDYRSPERFAGKRVVVIGGGQSALDIASEISFVAERTVLACRAGHHLLPPRVLGLPVDYLDIPLLSRMPWAAARGLAQALLVRSPLAPDRGELAPPGFSLLEHRWPVLMTRSIERALSQRTLAMRGAVDSFAEDRVLFADGESEQADTIVFATGYRVRFPFLAAPLDGGAAGQYPLYRRMVSPHGRDLGFVGVFDAGPGRLQLTELQGRWLAALFAGRIALPETERMWAAIDGCGEPRTRERFASAGRHTVLCDRHAYARILRGDLARAAAERTRH
jgi:cation diffusion facilitator CzcD-associated flavoprotein CzcO